jgi:hypothetical protein
MFHQLAAMAIKDCARYFRQRRILPFVKPPPPRPQATSQEKIFSAWCLLALQLYHFNKHQRQLQAFRRMPARRVR